jgi:hypothetical protein
MTSVQVVEFRGKRGIGFTESLDRQTAHIQGASTQAALSLAINLQDIDEGGADICRLEIKLAPRKSSDGTTALQNSQSIEDSREDSREDVRKDV